MALALLLLNGTLLAGIYACAKIAGLSGIGPLGLLAWQLPAATALIALVAAAVGQWPSLTRSNVRYAATAGALGILFPSLITFAALRHVPSGTIGVIGALSPVFTYLIALARSVEAFSLRRAAGVALGLTGVLALLVPSGALPSGEALPWAIGAIGAPAFLAAGNVYRSVAWPDGLPPLGAALLMLAIQSAAIVPAAIAAGELVMPSLRGTLADVALVGAALMMTAFYLGAFQLQRRAGPVLVGQLGPVIAVASLAIGVVAFGDSYGITALAGVATVLTGVALVTTGSGVRHPASARPPLAGVREQSCVDGA